MVGALTQEIHIPRFGYLISYWVVGIFEEMPPWLIAEQDEILSFSVGQ